MRRQLRYSFSLWLLLISSLVLGQERLDSLEANTQVLEIAVPDSTILEKPAYVKETASDISQPEVTKQPSDTINYPFFSAFSISFDYPKLFSFFTEFENKAEVGVQTQLFKHILLVAELGRGRIQPTNFYKNANYEVSGNYARLGAAYTKSLGAKSRLNFGFNYASSFFNDKGNIQIESPSGLFNPFEEDFKRESLRADWFELTFGTESHMGKNIYLGFIARIRVLNSYDSFEELDVFSIPGYGRTFDKSIPAVNMYIKYRIQVY